MTLREHRLSNLQETLEEVAKRGGLGVSTCSIAERGMVPTTFMFKRFAKAYRLPVSRIKNIFATSGGK